MAGGWQINGIAVLQSGLPFTVTTTGSRAEFFNIFNHPQFAIPASTIGSAGVGTITATSHPSRQIQFALKFVF